MALTPKDRLRLWWKTQPPKRKQQFKFAGLAAGVMGAVIVGSQMSGTGNHAAQEAALKNAEATNHQVYIEHPKSMSPKEMQSEINNLSDQMKRLVKLDEKMTGLKESEIKDLSQHVSKKLLAQIAKDRGIAVATTTSNPDMRGMKNDISALQNEISELKMEKRRVPYTPTTPAQVFYPAQMPQVLGAKVPSVNEPTTMPSNGVPKAPAAPSKTALQIHPVSKLKHISHVVKVKSKKGVYLPAGTILSGVLLTGLQAGTGPQAHSNPQIVDIRVKRRAVLPNGVRANFSSCFIIASGYGDMSTRRVYLRSNMLSCVRRRGGKVITAPIKAEVESGGLLGVPGKVISHQGPVILKSLLAGIFSGLGNAVQPTSVQGLNLNPTSGSAAGFQSFNPAYLGESALAGGISTPAGEISKFYLHEAESLLPTIQINPGVAVDMFLVSGTRIHTNGETSGQLAEASYAAASSMNNQATPAPQQTSTADAGTSPYVGTGQSSAVSAAFPDRQTVQREEQDGQTPNLRGQP
ncbi:conjugal transfer protein [Acidithiobacillus sp. HP-6]|uniref:TrbI/VirB10 family protein n=1 Tax=unclassified Acidithiobacillus TaxID=2614800 RepID=UPI00187A149E|nr:MULTISPECIES: TrbI/VirB10 family protein [unclassified Acidithiobacillus]MBE7562206.1 conjugal transfer protein [Acidithiobacillus sp. HP-6]MBE7568931.1 conjugal transfer protein [Acidithiobacillus sp. HP-2]